ncbi:MAG: hypothetical protein WCJ62_03950 [Flavobacterium sp.]
MKTKVFFLLYMFLTFFASAQKENCGTKEKQLSQFIAENDYEKANEVWNEIKVECPSFSENVYLLGNKVLQYNIEIADSKDKEKEVRELLKLYNQFDKNFPENRNGNFEKRAMALYESKVGTNDEIYSYLDQAFSKQKKSFSNPQALLIYFEMYFEKYKLEKSSISIDNLLEKYTDINSLLEFNRLQFPAKINEYSRVASGMDSYMQNLLICENLVPYAQKNFESNKSDVNWLLAAAQALSVKCNNKPIFETIALELHNTKPSSKSAYYLATYYLNTGNQDKSIAFFKESIELTSDKNEKATTAYTLASILASSDKAKSKEMMLVAMENNPSNGKYYIFLANLYANAINDCASTDIEKKGMYKLASDTALKAINIEPRYKITAENMSKDYLKNVVFDSKSKVKSVHLRCWINQTVQF